jgi:excisionase family DNA binding protein
MAQEWVSIADACVILGISKSTLYRKINHGEIESKKDGKTTKCLINVPDESHNGTNDTVNETLQVMGQLRSENEYLRQQVTQLQAKQDQKDEDIRQKDNQIADASQRHDTIVLQLTRQLEQSQRMLEAHRDPFWKKWFRKDRNRITE